MTWTFSFPGKLHIGCILLFISFFGKTVSAQITDFIPERNYSDFTIRSERKTMEGKNFLLIYISRNNVILVTDSVLTDKKNCTGFAMPDAQPFKDYFIFSK